MFDHEIFDNYNFEDIPLDRDLFFMDEVYREEYENSMLRLTEGVDCRNVGEGSYMATRKINNNSAELSLIANISVRYHEVSIILPKDQFVACVECWKYGEKPRVFVKSAWLKSIHTRSYSIFALIDGIGVKKALKSGKIKREKLIELRSRIDSISEKYPDILFISFADNIWLKSNWTVGHFESTVRYKYEPEVFIRLASEIKDIYKTILGLSTYTIITQGSNEYYDDQLSHISKSKNHISLNSLGAPFAQLWNIDDNAKKAFKTGEHQRTDLYLDELFYYSLNFKYEFDKKAAPSKEYDAEMMGTSRRYYYSTIEKILTNLESDPAS